MLRYRLNLWPWRAYLYLFSQVLRRNRVLRRLRLPHDRHDPPALAVVYQLKAVDAALKGLIIAGVVARLVGAEHLSNVAELLNFVRNAALEKSFLLEKWSGALDVIVGREHACAHLGLVRTLPRRNQPRAGIEQRMKAIPVTLLAGRT